mmetsp:Transcript_24923/g.57755  ORF Transcript_24923/g.57755 Transcript_24923/m.57755 type:complete len:203 (+) Transcript_24923:261-869(+)
MRGGAIRSTTTETTSHPPTTPSSHSTARTSSLLARSRRRRATSRCSRRSWSCCEPEPAMHASLRTSIGRTLPRWSRLRSERRSSRCHRTSRQPTRRRWGQISLVRPAATTATAWPPLRRRQRSRCRTAGTRTLPTAIGTRSARSRRCRRHGSHQRCPGRMAETRTTTPPRTTRAALPVWSSRTRTCMRGARRSRPQCSATLT